MRCNTAVSTWTSHLKSCNIFHSLNCDIFLPIAVNNIDNPHAGCWSRWRTLVAITIFQYQEHIVTLPTWFIFRCMARLPTVPYFNDDCVRYIMHLHKHTHKHTQYRPVWCSSERRILIVVSTRITTLLANCPQNWGRPKIFSDGTELPCLCFIELLARFGEAMVTSLGTLCSFPTGGVNRTSLTPAVLSILQHVDLPLIRLSVDWISKGLAGISWCILVSDNVRMFQFSSDD